MQDLSFITAWIDQLFRGVMPGWAATTIECLLVGVGLLLVYSLLALFYIYYERKLCAAFQCRLGPNRVGPWGLLQSFADMFKMLIKEIIHLDHIDLSIIHIRRCRRIALCRSR
ncbi:MAG: NADH-quinone oxidoreductase subunit H, partial [Muribaculaceae bacterium]|nr:NADH-quinone oxidoreductase subunit H [Muribaculaceae bacterium]